MNCVGTERKQYGIKVPVVITILNVTVFYQVLPHIHCKQLGSELAFYESIYVRSILLNYGLMIT